MSPLVILIAAIPVLWFAYVAWSRAIRMMRQDAKEAAALKLADSWPPFARAYDQMKKYAAFLCSGESPWHRPEHGSRSVYVMRGSHE